MFPYQSTTARFQTRLDTTVVLEPATFEDPNGMTASKSGGIRTELAEGDIYGLLRQMPSL